MKRVLRTKEQIQETVKKALLVIRRDLQSLSSRTAPITGVKQAELGINHYFINAMIKFGILDKMKNQGAVAMYKWIYGDRELDDELIVAIHTKARELEGEVKKKSALKVKEVKAKQFNNFQDLAQVKDKTILVDKANKAKIDKKLPQPNVQPKIPGVCFTTEQLLYIKQLFVDKDITYNELMLFSNPDKLEFKRRDEGHIDLLIWRGEFVLATVALPKRAQLNLLEEKGTSFINLKVV